MTTNNRDNETFKNIAMKLGEGGVSLELRKVPTLPVTLPGNLETQEWKLLPSEEGHTPDNDDDGRDGED